MGASIPCMLILICPSLIKGPLCEAAYVRQVEPVFSFDRGLERYPDRVVKANLNTPGIYSLHFSFRQAKSAKWLEMFQHPDWCFSLQLEATKCGGESHIFCEELAGSSTNSTGNFALPLSPGADHLSARWRYKNRFEHFVKKAQTREYVQKLLVAGRWIECPCVEGVIPFTLEGETMDCWQIVWISKKSPFQERIPKSFKCDGELTLRLCPTLNWYYVKLHYANQEIGPGWHEASATAHRGYDFGSLHLTDFEEEYTVRWEKRIPMSPDGRRDLFPWTE
jgi:hypothetical protein